MMSPLYVLSRGKTKRRKTRNGDGAEPGKGGGRKRERQDNEQDEEEEEEGTSKRRKTMASLIDFIIFPRDSDGWGHVLTTDRCLVLTTLLRSRRNAT